MVRPVAKVQAELQKLDLLTGQDTAQRSAYLNGKSAELSPGGFIKIIKDHQKLSQIVTDYQQLSKIINYDQNVTTL